LPSIAGTLGEGGWLFITADHGNDPVSASTDHSREYVPLLCRTPGTPRGRDLGIRASFADVGRTIADIFSLPRPDIAGESFYGIVGG
jgi:phosphopentomutase